jgi:hypothetical protein
MYEYIDQKDGEMVICECLPPIFDMFDIAGVFLIVPSATTLEEALIKIGASV